MKKIGFIDYYLDEWHANNYPEFIRNEAGDEFTVFGAWAKIDSPIGGMTNKEWSEKYSIPLYDTVEDLIDACDYLIVLSPDNPEMHEELCKIPLSSGKNTYVDKTFATDAAMAKRIFENADKHSTKCYSSSALNYAIEYQHINTDNVERIASMGPGTYEMYSIHQIEPIVKLMGIGAKRVMSTGTDKFPASIIEYEDGRIASIANFPAGSPFVMNIGYKDSSTEFVKIEEDFFAQCIKNMLKFFKQLEA